ncbi:MAG: hypothetical protein HY532_06645 [Chloroflexi bacterium]|nr:hypothetical protein [Chloroflexota bacterium]
MSSSTRWLIGIALGVALLTIVSAVIALARERDAPLLPEGTPEGVVQRFLNAIQGRDYVQVHSYLSSQLQTYCTASHIRESLRWWEENTRNIRVELLSTTEVEDGKKEVRVRVTEVTTSPPFGANEYSHQEFYLLVQQDESWRIDEPPWPIGWCPDLEKRAASAPR